LPGPDNDALMTYSTDSVPVRARAAFWRQAICDTFVSVDCRVADVERFSGAISTRRVNGLTVSCVRSGRHDVTRVSQHRPGNATNTLLISYQRRGSAAVVQDGRTAVLQPGQFAIYDTGRRYSLHLGTECEQIVLGMDSAWADARFGQTRMLVARAAGGDQQLGRLASAVFQRLCRFEDRFGPLAERHLCDAAGSVIAANFAVLADVLPDPQRSGRSLLLLRTKAFIEDNVRCSELTSGDIAREVGVSVRYLQEIFQADETSMMSYLWRRRLDLARRMLDDPARRGESIGEIAFACGFKDFSHFSVTGAKPRVSLRFRRADRDSG